MWVGGGSVFTDKLHINGLGECLIMEHVWKGVRGIDLLQSRRTILFFFDGY